MAVAAMFAVPSLLVVGSKNTAKIKAVEYAIHDIWPKTEVVGVPVESGVSAQPWGDSETLSGASQRAKAAWQHPQAAGVKSRLGIGLEGGVFEDNGEVWLTVWVSVCDGESYWNANGARIRVPERLVLPMRTGREMGEVMAELMNQADIKSHGGMLGVVTGMMVDRARGYGDIARLALGLWSGRDWESSIQKGTTAS